MHKSNNTKNMTVKPNANRASHCSHCWDTAEGPAELRKVCWAEGFVCEYVVKKDADGYCLVVGDAGDELTEFGLGLCFVLLDADTELHAFCENIGGNEIAIVGCLAEPVYAGRISAVIHCVGCAAFLKAEHFAETKDAEPSLGKTVVAFRRAAEL